MPLRIGTMTRKPLPKIDAKGVEVASTRTLRGLFIVTTVGGASGKDKPTTFATFARLRKVR